MSDDQRRPSGDDPPGMDAFLRLLYDELRELASRYIRRERDDHTLQATALLHEAYLRLAGLEPHAVHGAAHFYALSARTMRRVLVDHARARSARAGGVHVSISNADAAAPGDTLELLRLDEALRKLARHDAASAEIVLLRFFGGLTTQEIATVKGLGLRTVEKRWAHARAWLRREIHRSATHPAAEPP